ncbi:hypothetical protein ABES03_16360 [Neobacillus rhizosphaerae]|uniref:hypothetical protein n=1 Tax=Neobacillus rhizosphaerae TaxID=2880965 RepID=UPI003D2864AA
MDILGMLNDYIKNNKTDEQLANEFTILLNKGQSIEKIAKLYEYPIEKVTELIKNSENKNGGTSYQGISANSAQGVQSNAINTKNDLQLSNEFVILLNKGQSIDKIAELYEYPIEKVKEILKTNGYRNVVASYEKKNPNGVQNFNKQQSTKTDEHLAIEFANLLNTGHSIEKVAKLHNYTEEKVIETLHNTGYTYYGFSRKWKRTSEAEQSTNDLKNELQLAKDLAAQLNKGHSIGKLAKSYNYSEEKIKEILHNGGYTFYGFSRKWKRSNEPKITNTSSNKTELKISIDIIVDLLNDGITLEQISKQYHIPIAELQSLLIRNGFKYYSFMNYWTKLDQEELCEYLVKELNQGLSIYDISGKYVKSNKERIAFVSYLENYLKVYRYSYNSHFKKWERMSSTEALPLMIKELNNGNSIKNVARMFKTTVTNLQQELKKAHYRYDPLFKFWTKDNRNTLVRNLANDLYEGKVSFEDLKERNLNIKVIEIELKHSGVRYTTLDNQVDHKREISKKLISDNQLRRDLIKEELNKSPFITEQMLLDEDEEEKNDFKTLSSITKKQLELFDSEEVSTLKEIILSWKQKKSEESSIGNEKIETTIFMNSALLKQLTTTSEKKGLSRSRIIEDALKAYFNN